MKRRITVLVLTALAFLSGNRSSSSAQTGDEVVVIYNKKVPASEDVARHYAEVRRVPKEQVIGFKLSADEEISRAEYEESIAKPLAHELESRKLWRIGTARWPITNASDLREVRVPIESKIRHRPLLWSPTKNCQRSEPA